MRPGMIAAAADIIGAAASLIAEGDRKNAMPLHINGRGKKRPQLCSAISRHHARRILMPYELLPGARFVMPSAFDAAEMISAFLYAHTPPRFAKFSAQGRC